MSLASVELKGLIVSSVLVSKLLNVVRTGVLTAAPSHWLFLYAADKHVLKRSLTYIINLTKQ
jgi:hypothetical protein